MPTELKPKRARRTKAQMEAERVAKTTATVAAAAAQLEQTVAVAPPSDLLGKVSRAMLGCLATQWPALLNEDKYPSPFTMQVRVIGREAEVTMEWQPVITRKATVTIDDGEQDLPLTAEPTAAASIAAPLAPDSTLAADPIPAPKPRVTAADESLI